MFEKLCLYLNTFLKLSFEDDDFENKFRKEYTEDNLKQNKFAVKLTLLAYLTYIPVGYFITPNEFYEDLILMLLLPINTSVIFLYYIEKIKNKKSIYLFLYSITITIPPIISLFNTTEYHQIYLNNYILVVIGIMVIYGAFFFITFLSVFFVNIVATIILFNSKLEFSEIYYHLFYINIAFIVTSIASYLIEKSKRKIYFNKYSELKLKKEIEKQNEFIEQQTRMAQMGEMLSMIAHQWRQPLGSINTNILGIKTKIERGKYNLNNEDEQKEFLDFLNKKHSKIIDYTKFLSETINDFSNFFKPDRELEKKPLTQPIEKSLSIIKGTLEHYNINVIKDYKTNDIIPVFHNELMQVYLNILQNSKDNFIERNIKDKEIKIVTETKNNKYITKIFDNGGGIDEKIINKIFDPYFSTKDERTGTGLGLYMSKTIIETHHKGQLNVRNTEEGICFEIILNGDVNV